MNVKLNFRFSEYTDLEAILNKLKNIEVESAGVIKIEVNADEIVGNIPRCTGITQALKIDKQKENIEEADISNEKDDLIKVTEILERNEYHTSYIKKSDLDMN